LCELTLKYQKWRLQIWMARRWIFSTFGIAIMIFYLMSSSSILAEVYGPTYGELLTRNAMLPSNFTTDVLDTIDNQNSRIIEACSPLKVIPGENATMKQFSCHIGMVFLSKSCLFHNNSLSSCSNPEIEDYLQRYNLSINDVNVSKIYQEFSEDLGEEE
jgi:hypothetical protein